MRAVIYEDFWGPDVLKLVERSIPKPNTGQVLLEVMATSVNPIDRRLRSGELQPFFQRTFPIVSGWDVTGRIVEVAPGVSGWKVGDEVVGLGFSWHLQHGAYAEYMPIVTTAIALKPGSLSWYQAAALPLLALHAELRSCAERGRARGC